MHWPLTGLVNHGQCAHVLGLSAAALALQPFLTIAVADDVVPSS